MGRIKKVATERHTATLSPAIKSFVEEASSIPLHQLPQKLSEFPQQWPLPRGDLYHWIALLDRFDRVLELFNKEYGLNEGPQTQPFECRLLIRGDADKDMPDAKMGTELEGLDPHVYSEEGDRELVESIVSFTRVLFEHCGNRSLYASSGHINDLMHTTSLSLLRVCLKLSLRLAQRYQVARIKNNSPHAQPVLMANHYSFNLENMHKIAMPFPKSTVPSAAPAAAETPGKGKDKATQAQPFNPLDLVTFAKEPSVLYQKEDLWSMSISYYDQPAPASRPSTAQQASEASPAVTPTPVRRTSNLGPSRDQTSVGDRSATTSDAAPTPAKSRDSEAPSASAPKVFSMTASKVEDTPVWLLVREAVLNVPAELRYDVLNRLRVAKNLAGPEDFHQEVLEVRLLAIANLAYSLGESKFQEKIGNPDSEEPRRYHLAQQLCDLLQPPTSKQEPLSLDLETAVVMTLEAISKTRHKFMEVADALAITVNHGVLYYELRKVLATLHDQEHMDRTRELRELEWREATFDLINTLQQSNTAARHGERMVQAGIMGILVEALTLRTSRAERFHDKILSFFTSFVHNISSSFQTLANIKGFDILADLTQYEVQSSLEAAQNGTGLAPVFRSRVIDYDIPYLQQATLRQLFKFTVFMFEHNAGTHDRLLRNLIDTPQVLGALKTVLEHAPVFGSNVWTGAVNIMSNFIHNEPTSYQVIGEAGLSKSLLECITQTELPDEVTSVDDFKLTDDDMPPDVAIVDGEPQYPDVKGILPVGETMCDLINAFGAICLNGDHGLKLFQNSKALVKYFDIFVSPVHVRALEEEGANTASAIGNAFDELSRHHPQLKEQILKTVLHMVKRVVKLCANIAEYKAVGAKLWERSPDSPMASISGGHAALCGTPQSALDSARATGTPVTPTVRTAQVCINNVNEYDREGAFALPILSACVKFLEGFFHNQSMCTSFCEMGGAEHVLDLALSPSNPYDLMSFPIHNKISHVLRNLSEAKAHLVLPSLLRRVENELECVYPILHTGQARVFDKFQHLKDPLTLNSEDIWPAGMDGTTFIKSLANLYLLTDTLSSILMPLTAYANRRNNQSSQLFTTINFTDVYIKLIDKLGTLHAACMWENQYMLVSHSEEWKRTTDPKAFIPRRVDLNGFVELATESRFSDSQTNGITEAPTSPASNEQLEVKNIRALRYLLGQTPSGIEAFFSSLGQALVPKRPNDVSTKQHASLVAEHIAQSALSRLDYVKWPSPDSKHSLLALRYMVQTLMSVSSTMLSKSFEHYGQKEAMSLVLNKFYQLGGFKKLNECLQTFSSLLSTTVTDRSSAEDSTYVTAREGLRVVLELFSNVVRSKCITEAFQSNVMSVRDNTQADFFLPGQFLVEIREAVLPAVSKLWYSEAIDQIGPHQVKIVIEILRVILKGEGEERALKRSDDASRRVQTTRVEFKLVNTVGVSSLEERGFDRDLAREALYRCNSQEPLAREYCMLRKPDAPVTAPRFPIPENESQDPGAPSAADSDPSASLEQAPALQRQRSVDMTEAEQPEQQAESETPIMPIVTTSDITLPDSDIMSDDEHAGPLGSLPADVGERDLMEMVGSGRLHDMLDLTSANMNGNHSAGPSTAPPSRDTKQPFITIDDLNDKRGALRDALIERCLEVLSAVPSISFELSDLIQAAFVRNDKNPEQDKGPREEIATTLVSSLISLQGEEGPEVGAKISAYAHLVALILQDSEFFASTLDELKQNFDSLVSWIDLSDKQNAEDAPWMEMVLLIIERVLAEDEQPHQLEWNPPPNDDPLKALAEPQFPEPAVPDELKSQLFGALVDALPKIGKNGSLALCVARVLVTLTRKRDLAVRLSDKKSMSSLFMMIRQLAGSVDDKLHGAFMLILRHMVEDKQIIRQIMETEIRAAFEPGSRSSRALDTTTYARNLYHLVLRGADLFLEVTKDLLDVTRYDGSPHRAQALALKREKPTTSQNSNDKADADAQPSTEAADVAASSEAQKADETKPPTVESSDGVVAFLLRELTNYKDVEDRASVSSKEPKLLSQSSTTNGDVAMAEASSAPSPSAVAEQPASETEKVDKPFFKPEEHSIYIYRCFILQCLAELLSSYDRTKVEFINFSRKPETTPATPSKPRAGTLNYLLNTLIPVGTLHHRDDIQHRKKLSTSNWATTVLVSLCARTPERSTSPVRDDGSAGQDSDLTFVQRFVLEHALRAFKDATVSIEPLDQRYSRLLSLAELFNRMLNHKGTAAASSSTTASQQMGKLMYEKNFIGALTCAVAELDLNFPDAKRAVKYILGPLRSLTDLGVTLSENAELSSSTFGTSTDGEDEISSATSVSDGEDQHERERTPNLLQNTSLDTGDPQDDDDGEEDDDDDEEMSEDEDFGEGMDYEEDEVPEHGDVVSDEDEDIDGMGNLEGVPGDMAMDVEIVMDGDEPNSEDDDDMDDEEDDSEDDDEDDGDDDAEFADHMHLEEMTGDDENGSLADHEEAGGWEEDDGDAFDEHDEGDGSPHGGPLDHIAHVLGADDHSDTGEGDGVVRIDMGNGEEEYFEDELPPEDGEEEDEEAYEHDVVYEPEADGEDDEDGGMAFGWDMPPPPHDPRLHRHHHHHHMGDFRRMFGMVGGDALRPPTFRSHRTSTNARGEDDGTNPLLQRGGGGNGGGNRDFEAVADSLTRLRAPRLGLPRGGEAFIQDLVASVGVNPGGAGNVHITMDNALPRGLPGMFGRSGLIDIDPSRPIREQLRFPFNEFVGFPTARFGDRAHAAGNDEAQAVEFHSTITVARWQEEARMLFGGKHHEKSTRIVNALLRLLVPAAMQAKREHDEAEKVRRAAEEKAREEEKKKAEAAKVEREAREKKEREEREAEETARREQEEREAREAENAETVDMQGVEPGESSAAVIQPPASTDVLQTEEPPAPRITTTIRGRELDITLLGIDRDFLDAIPEDMREEVIMAQLQEQRSQAVQSGEQPSEISREFLEALPRDIQRELLRSEAEERRRQERSSARRAAQQEGSAHPAQPEDMDNADFMAMLDPGLRQTILMDADETVLATLPEVLQAEARALLGDRLPPPTHGLRRAGDGNGIRFVNSNGRPAMQVAEQANKQRRPIVQMLDKPGVATLLRLMFVSLHHKAKSNLHSILSDVCKNTQNRAEVISILLSILQDGTADMGAVERSFAQLSLRAKQLPGPKTPQPLKRTPTGLTVAPATELSPLNIVQQCLATLNALAADNPRVPSFFLTEHETITSQKVKVVKKGKGRESKAAKYPLNAVLMLLDRKLITENTAVMETLAALLSRVTHPLTLLLRKVKDGGKPDIETDNAQQETGQDEGRLEAASGDVPMTEVALAAASNAGASGPASVPEPDPSTEVHQEASKANEHKTRKEIAPPEVPEENIRLVVNILAARECPSKTFSDTLDIIKNLSAIPGAKEVFGKELVRQAQELGQTVLADLEELANQINAASTGTDLRGLALANFSTSGSKQRKLLRVILALDHLFDPKRSHQGLASPMPMDPKIRDDVLATLYESSTFEKLWSNLTLCLAAIRRRGNMVNVANILLPLIEAFMVVCRNSELKQTSASAVVTSPGDTGATTPPSESRMEDLFYRFTEENRKILNELIRNNPKLMSGHLSVMAKNSKVLEFDNKRTYFSRKLHHRGEGRTAHQSLQLSIRRDQVFLDSFKSLYYKSADEIKYGKLNIRFHGEEGIDAGGVSREWFAAMARQMFNPDYALFNPVASDRTTFHPNSLSDINTEHLLFFKFVGRIIGKALYENRVLDCHFSRAVYRRILGKSVSLKDMESLDLNYYKGLVWILENQITGVTFDTFSVERDRFGETETIDLITDGRNIEVTDENKQEYVQKVVEYRLVGSVQGQLDEFLKGFHDIIPSELISIFNEQELELLISGLPDIDIDDWRHQSEYHNYQPTSPQIQWFWRAVRSFDKEEKAKLLQFVTGTSKVPLNGFKELEGMNGFAKFNIHRDYSSKEKLPSSHTCFNRKLREHHTSVKTFTDIPCRTGPSRVRELRAPETTAVYGHHGWQRILRLRVM